jgi:hypothetical protein
LVIAVQTDETAFNFIQDSGGWPNKGPFHSLLVFGGGLDVEHFIISG